jgi:iron complex outermembrane receptor protein
MQFTMNPAISAAVARALGVMACCGLAHGAFAQQATASAAATADNSGLEEVVVTAERRAEDLSTTPISITALSGDAMKNQQMATINDLQLAAPALTVNQSGIYNSVNIRGVGNTVISPVIQVGVAVFRDGLFQAETIGLNEPFFDIADTEVLKGPQGTFIGQSSTGGAILINSQNPKLDTGLDGYAEAGYGSYGDTTITGAVNLPISDTVAARVAFYTEQRGSFYYDQGAQQTAGLANPVSDPGSINDRDFRIGLLWKPNEKFQALFKTEYEYESTNGEPASPVQGTYTFPSSIATADPFDVANQGPNFQIGGVGHSTYYAYSTHVPFLLNFDRVDNIQIVQWNRYSLDLKYTLPGEIVLRSLSGIQTIHEQQDGESDYSSAGSAYDSFACVGTCLPTVPLGGTVYGPGSYFPTVSGGTGTGPGAFVPGGTYYNYNLSQPGDEYYSQEFNLISPTTGKLTWILGASFFSRDTPVQSTTTNQFNYYPLPQYNFTEIQGESRMVGLFGQVTWQFTHDLQLQVGARENWDSNFNQGYNFRLTPVSATGAAVSNPATQLQPCTAGSAVGFCNYAQTNLAPNSSHFKDVVPTAKIDLNYTPIEGQFFYAFYTRGYKSGGANAPSAAGPTAPFQPEFLNDYEIGWKGKFLNNHINTSLGLYYTNYQNFQQSNFNPANLLNLVQNLASSTLKGIEFSTDARLGRLGANLSIAYNQSALGNTPLFATYIAATDPGTRGDSLNGCAGTPGGNPTKSNLGVNCYNYAPYLVNVAGEELPNAPKLTADLAVDYAIPVGDYTLRPRVTYTHIDSQYASVFQSNFYYLPARNLLGATLSYEAGPWLAQAFGKNLTNQIYPDGINGQTVFYGDPRVFGIRVNRKF